MRNVLEGLEKFMLGSRVDRKNVLEGPEEIILGSREQEEYSRRPQQLILA